MTKKEAFLNVVQVGTIDDSTAEMYLLSAGIIASDQFNGNLNELELAAVPCLQSLLPMKSTSEDEASWAYDREGIKDRLLFLARKHCLNDIISELTISTPIIKAYNGWGL